MRILQSHAEFIEYEPIQKEISSAEEVERRKYRVDDTLVLFVCVEEGDDNDIAVRAVEDVKTFLGKIGINRLLIYPFAHLSQNLAEPVKALRTLEEMERRSRELAIETHRAPFGWNKQFQLKIKGHPLAEQFRVYGGQEIVGKVEPGQRARKMGKRPAVQAEKLSESDHRVIGPRLDLYSFHEAGPGMAFLHHKGVVLRNILLQFWRMEHEKNGYLEISTPILLNRNLWEISGHWEHFKEMMFMTETEDQEFALKPMNCPGAMLVYKTNTRSYKELPLRLAELGLVSRNELSGVLAGLFRVRVFTQDDAHIFVTPEQLEDEIIRVIELVDYFYSVFGFEYRVELSTRPEKAMGSIELWNKAEAALMQALQRRGTEYKLNPGEGAFYGPKIDFHIKDSLGRSWQLATLQVDFQMSERFDLNFIGEDGRYHRPVIIHRVILGSIERFVGILVEHYQAKFPVWLSPIQVRVLPIGREDLEYAERVRSDLAASGIRVDSDSESKTIEYRIRNAILDKVPYMVIVGPKERQSNTVAIRDRSGRVDYSVSPIEFVERLRNEIREKK